MPSKPWAYRAPAEASSPCTFTCETGAEWNGTTCVKTREATCLSKPSNSRWVNGDSEFTQTLVFSGSVYIWTPSNIAAFQSGNCSFDCIG